MSQVVADVIKANIEFVRPKIPSILELEATAYNLLAKSAEKFRISATPNSADFRAPIKTQVPSSFGTFSMANGSLGSGAGYKVNQFVQTYFPLKLACTVDYSAMVATSGGKDLARLNAWKENMKDALPSFASMQDRSFHARTGGLLATSTGLSTATYTFDTTFGANLLQKGMPVEVVSSGNVWVTSAVSPDSLPTVTAIDKGARTATISSTVGGAIASGDSLYFQGAIAAGPTATWLDGLYTWHTTSTSGTLGGVTKTAEDIMPNLVNAAGSLVPAHIWQGKELIRQRRGNSALSKKWKGLIHGCQAAAIRTLGLSVVEMQVANGGAFKTPDLAGGVGDSVTFGDVEHLIDVHQDKTRIDWIVPQDNWCRVYGQEVDFWKRPDGGYIYEGRNGDGAVTASFSFFLNCVENFLCADPGAELVVYNLSIPSGF